MAGIRRSSTRPTVSDSALTHQVRNQHQESKSPSNYRIVPFFPFGLAVAPLAAASSKSRVFQRAAGHHRSSLSLTLLNPISFALGAFHIAV